MALTPQEFDAHVAARETQLNLPYYTHRRHWPSRLFHHSAIENVVKILAQGVLRARADPNLTLERDIAGEGVIDLRLDAHEYVRLYFRPRTPTQFHIEGVRKKNECEFGFQAPILIMLVLEAKPIFTRAGTQFSDENMQRASAAVGETAEFLSAIPWEKVYHEGGLAGDYSIIRHRCAEVLATSPLPLKQCLQWIYCRSEAERDTLIYLLGDDGLTWKSKIRVSDDIRVFNRLLSYVEHVHLSHDGVIVELHPRNDGANVDFRLHALDPTGAVIAEFINQDFQSTPPQAKRWRIPCTLIAGSYVIRIWLEEELAFESLLRLGDDLV